MLFAGFSAQSKKISVITVLYHKKLLLMYFNKYIINKKIQMLFSFTNMFQEVNLPSSLRFEQGEK